MVESLLYGQKEDRILILGVGNILFTDEGFGVRAVERLQERYVFPGNVSIEDGGVLGMNLLGVISQATHLIVLDAIRNGGSPGTLYRLEKDEIPRRILAKNSLHQVDLLEALTLCQALGNVPETVIFGVEPLDITTLSLELSPVVSANMDQVLQMALDELRGLGVEPIEKRMMNVQFPVSNDQGGG